MQPRVNGRVGVLVTLVGVALCGTGLWAGGNDVAAWSSLLLNAGTAVALLAAFVALEPRIVRTVTRAVDSAATDAAERATSELRDRVVRLENLDTEQEAERTRRRAVQHADIASLLTDGLKPAVVGGLIATGFDEKLFDADYYGVRTSRRPDTHVLHMLAVKAANGVSIMWLDFEPFEWSGEFDPATNLPFPVKRNTTTIWVNNDPASEIASQLEAGLERANRPRNDFSLAYALRELADGVQLMRTARAAERGDASRLEGALRLKINDRWVITTNGLEAIHTAAMFPTQRGGFRGDGAYWPGSASGCERPADEPQHEWDEAIAWLSDREGLEVLAPGQRQEHPGARFLRHTPAKPE